MSSKRRGSESPSRGSVRAHPSVTQPAETDSGFHLQPHLCSPPACGPSVARPRHPATSPHTPSVASTPSSISNSGKTHCQPRPCLSPKLVWAVLTPCPEVTLWVVGDGFTLTTRAHPVLRVSVSHSETNRSGWLSTGKVGGRQGLQGTGRGGPAHPAGRRASSVG